MAKLQITDAQKTFVDAADTHLHNAFLEGTAAPSSPTALPPMELYDTLSEADPIPGQPGQTRDLKAGVRLVFRQVLAAVAKALNIKRPLPDGFTGAIAVLGQDGITPKTITVEDGFILSADGSGGGSGGSGRTVLATACQTTDQIGDLVIPTTGTGRTVKKVNSTDELQMPAIGVIVEKPTATTATVQTAGPVEGVYAGLTPGRRYYVGSTGRPALDATSGLATGTLFFIQAVGVALDDTTLLLVPSFELAQFEAP